MTEEKYQKMKARVRELYQRRISHELEGKELEEYLYKDHLVWALSRIYER